MKTPSIKELIENPRAGLASCILMGLLLLITLGQTLTQWGGDWELAHKTAAVTANNVNNPNADLIAKLPEQHLFGIQNREITGLPVTSLQMHVTGIMKLQQKQGNATSQAIISISGQPDKVYRVGDMLPNGVKIDSITKDAVILKNNGHLERLPLPGREIVRKPKPVAKGNEQ